MGLESNPGPMPPNFRSRTTTERPSVSEAQFLLMSDKDSTDRTGGRRGPGDGVCGGTLHGVGGCRMLFPLTLSLHRERQKQRKRREF